MTSITIAIPTHNRAELLGQTLMSLAAVRVPAGVRVNLIVVADGCTDATLAVAEEALRALAFPGRVIPADYRNLSRGRNRCIEESDADVVLFLDDDVWVDPGVIEGHAQVYSNTSASITGGTIQLWWRDTTRPAWMSDSTSTLLTERLYDLLPRRLSQPWDAAGANFGLRRDVAAKVGGFRPGLGRSGNLLLAGEETEFVKRAIAAGLELWSAPASRVQHYVNPKRVESPAYVLAVSRGLGASHVFMRDSFGPLEVFRQFTGRSVLLCRDAMQVVAARVRGDARATVDARCNVQINLGSLSATWTRVTGRSPVPPEIPMLDLTHASSAQPEKAKGTRAYSVSP